MRFAPLFILVLVMTSGCASNVTPFSSVNTRCPVMPQQNVDGATFVEWNGLNVGFCCAECIDHWDRMTDARKNDAIKLAK